MYYLINCDTYDCVNFQAILGVADNKRSVMELLYNFHKQNYSSNLTFEKSNFDIQIIKISENNYNYLLDEINKNINKIRKNHEMNKYLPECQYSEYLFIILDKDEPNYDIFDKDFHKRYYNIISKSKQILI